MKRHFSKNNLKIVFGYICIIPHLWGRMPEHWEISILRFHGVLATRHCQCGAQIWRVCSHLTDRVPDSVGSQSFFTEKTTVLSNFFPSSSLRYSACHFICLNQKNENNNNNKPGCSLLWFGLINHHIPVFFLSVWMTHKMFLKKVKKDYLLDPVIVF